MNKYALFGLELHGQKINGKDAQARDSLIQSCNVVFQAVCNNHFL